MFKFVLHECSIVSVVLYCEVVEKATVHNFTHHLEWLLQVI